MAEAKSRFWLAYASGAFVLTAAMFIQALATWKNFSTWSVLAVGFTMLTIFAILAWLLKARLTVGKLAPASLVRQMAAGIGFGLFSYLVAFPSFNIWAQHFPTFVLQDLDAGLKFHQDSAFHTSLMQSILNLGYSSTGLSGSPITFYYVVSHYADALVNLIAGLNPLLSLGLLFHFKKLLVILAATVFVREQTKTRSAWFQAISFVVLLPLLMGTWHLIGSEGLWFASVLLLLAAPRIWEIIRKRELTTGNYVFIGLIIYVVTVSKLSSGMMLTAFIGAFLVITEFRKLAFWVWSAACVAWIGFWALVFSTSHSTNVKFNPANVIDFVLLRSQPNAKYVYIFLTVFAVVAFLIKQKPVTQFFVTTVITAAVMFGMATIFSGSDLFYVQFGYYFSTLMFGIMFLLDQPVLGRPLNTWQLKVGAAALVAVTALLPMVSVNLFATPDQWRGSITEINSGYFKLYNRVHHSNVSLAKVLAGANFDTEASGPMSNFVSKLHEFTNANHLTGSNSELFVSKDIYLNELSQLGGETWAKGLLVHAITGIPLVNGIYELHLGYGFKNYNKSELLTNDANHVLTKNCGLGKQIVVVESFKNPAFRLGCN